MSKKKPVTKAIVLEDGSVVSYDSLQKYSTKGYSKQIPEDRFSGMYGDGTSGIIPPIYNPEAMAKLMEMNTYHYRAVKTKAHDTVGLGWYLEPADGVENPDESQKELVTQFLNDPHPDMTLGEVLTRWMEDYESIGYGYLELIHSEKETIKVNGKTIPLLEGIDHIPAHTVRRHMDEFKYVQIRGNKTAWFKRAGTPIDVDKDTGDKHPLGSLPYEKRANEAIYISNYTSRSDYYGVPDVLPALGAILGDKAREEFNIKFFENNAIPAYAVTVSGAELDEETEKTIKRFFQNDLKGNPHSTLVLYAEGASPESKIEFKFEKLAVEVKEASFILYRKDNRDEVLSAHGVPPYRAGIAETGSLGGSTATESTEIYKQSIINPRKEMVEARFNKHILRNSFGVTDWVLRFNEIDTRDDQRETDVNKKQFDMGILTPNKLRQMWGQEPYDHPLMDMPFINGVPIERLMTPPQSPMMQENELIESIKSLHSRLLDVVMK